MTDRLLSKLKSFLRLYTGVTPSCWLLISLHGVNSLLISLCYFLPLYFVRQLHFSIAYAGFTIAFYSLGTMAGGVMGGGTADRYSPRTVAIFSLCAQGIAFYCLAIWRQPAAIMTALFFLGAATYSFITANFLWAFALCRDAHQERLKVMNLMETAANLGLGLAAIAISLALNGDLQHLAVSASALLAAAAFIMMRVTPPQLSGSNLAVSSHARSSDLPFAPARLRLTIFIVFISLFMTGLIISQLGSTYSLFVHHAFPHYHLGGFGWLFALNTFLIVLLQTPLACHLRRYPPVLVMGTGAFLLGSGMFFLIFAVHYAVVIAACIVYTTGEMLFFSVAQLICYEQAPDDKKGLIMGGYRFVYALSRVAGPAAGSYLFEFHGGTVLWSACGVTGALCLIICLAYHYCTDELMPIQPLTNGASAANRAPE